MIQKKFATIYTPMYMPTLLTFRCECYMSSNSACSYTAVVPYVIVPDTDIANFKLLNFLHSFYMQTSLVWEKSAICFYIKGYINWSKILIENKSRIL